MNGKTESSLSWLMIIGILLNVNAGDTAESNAYVNLSFFYPQQNATVNKYCECGLFGLNSPVSDAQGVVGIPISPNLQGCDPSTKFSVTSKPWIALIERGNCTFSEKIILAASKGAQAVVIYNAPSSTGNQTIPMVHYGEMWLMLRGAKASWHHLSYSVLVLCFLAIQGSKSDVLWTANVNYSYVMENKTYWDEGEIGVYGHDSPVDRAYGLVVLPRRRQHHYSPSQCPPHLNFSVPESYNNAWIALIQRGDCPFSDKIKAAAEAGAKAVVIYNNEGNENGVFEMSHPGTKDTIAIMIGFIKGMEIVQLVRSNIQVTMVIEVGRKHGSWMNHYSIFFVSISFFVVTAATVGYFIFYSARRWRHTRAQNQKMKKLKDEAKKAISRLQLRTIKQGDKVLGPDGDSCAVCIDAYKANDVVRILTCNHFFHKNCIDPWLLEHRTCPMCKCDILKSLGIAADEEETDTTIAISSVSSELQHTTMQVEEENHSDIASSGYASVRGIEEVSEEPENLYENVELVNNDTSATATEVLPQVDNPTFEIGDESHIQSVKS